VKVARPDGAPYPAGIRAVQNNDSAPAETPAETAAAPEATEGQEG
jgi:large subunit ribosomal protein L3